MQYNIRFFLFSMQILDDAFLGFREFNEKL